MIEARLTDGLKLILFDTDKGKEIKSFPKKEQIRQKEKPRKQSSGK